MNSKNNPNFLTSSQQFPRVLTIIFCIIGFFLSTPSFAQRIISPNDLNGSFEQHAPITQHGGHWQHSNPSDVDDWNSSTNLIEVWRDGFTNGGITYNSQDGNYFVELNAKKPGALYQNMCLTNGEVIRWDFWHNARGGGRRVANPQIVKLDIVTTGGALVQTLATDNAPKPTGGIQLPWRRVQNATGTALWKTQFGIGS